MQIIPEPINLETTTGVKVFPNPTEQRVSVSLESEDLDNKTHHEHMTRDMPAIDISAFSIASGLQSPVMEPSRCPRRSTWVLYEPGPENPDYHMMCPCSFLGSKSEAEENRIFVHRRPPPYLALFARADDENYRERWEAFKLDCCQ